MVRQRIHQIAQSRAGAQGQPGPAAGQNIAPLAGPDCHGWDNDADALYGAYVIHAEGGTMKDMAVDSS